MTPAFAPPRPLAPANLIRVLVADDSVVVRGLIARWLQESGIEVVGTVPNGRLAIAALDRVAPDIVLLDLDMPDLAGMPVARRSRLPAEAGDEPRGHDLARLPAGARREGRRARPPAPRRALV